MNSLSAPALRASRRALLHAPIRSQVRYFHPTRPTRLVQEALETSTNLFCNIHSATYLPWVASIPLTALLVRTVVGLPIQLFTRMYARRERDLQPLLKSWQVVYERQATQADPTQNPKMAAMKHVKARHIKLRDTWNVAPGYQFAGLLQLPVWLSLIESLRAMSGTRTALFSWLNPLASADDSNSAELVEQSQAFFQPTLATEGALWFPDLLAGDPTGTLPALLTLSIILNIQMGWKTPPAREMADQGTVQLYRSFFFAGLRVMIQLLALNIGASGYWYQMPNALMIYWISSSNIATLQTFLLEKYMFVKPPIPAYKPKNVAYNNPGVDDPFKLRLR